MTHPLRSMNDIVDALVYDFTHFNLPDFINTLQHQRQRRIQVTGWSLTDDLFGVWIPATSADYIFYNQTRHPVHQTHTVLHLLAHLVLDHPPLSADSGARTHRRCPECRSVVRGLPR